MDTDMTERARLAGEIRAIRRSHGWSQSELAERSGVSLRTVQGAEAGQPLPSITALREIHRALGAGGEAPPQVDVFDDDVRSFQRMVGVFLQSLEGSKREAWIDKLTLVIVRPDVV